MNFSLTTVEAFLRDRIAPHAHRLDYDFRALQSAFMELGQQGWLGLKIPSAWGGYGLSAVEFQQFQELLSRYSGALAFLQAQHQSAGSFLSRSQQPALQSQYLPQMSTGAIAVGIGFSHLRRTPPPLTARPVPGGYQLNGTIPWITGFGVFQVLIGAAELPDQRAVYGMLPFQDRQTEGGSIRFSDPLALAAMTATQTVTADLQNWFLPADQVLWITSPRAIEISDRQNVLQHSFYALGCARAGLDLVAQAAQHRSDPVIQATFASLEAALNQCREEIYVAQARSFEDRVGLRARAIHLAVQCAHAAVIVSAGAANVLHHPAQRIYREALVFSVTGQTAAIRDASLYQLLIGSP